MLHICILLCAIIASLQGNESEFRDDENLIVRLKQGQVRGKFLNSTHGIRFSAFLGLPYGKVEKRFTDSQPADPWNGIRDATKDGPVCKQYDTFFKNSLLGQEDGCLVLNVYTSKLPKDHLTTLIPVMVFIHGGGFVMGERSSTVFGPELYMNKDLVLVVMNYRVGPIGFLSTGDEELPGNYGLLDQVLALRWVRENIERFGGDPNRVTISGESAGAASVIFHLLSPLSKGLFHGVIAESGSALCPWALRRNPLLITQKIAAKLNCSIDNTTVMAKCLRAVDSDLLSKAAADINEIPGDMAFPTVPVVENPINGKFLKESPLKLLSEGKFNKVPVISGVTSDEAALLVFKFLSENAMPSPSNLTEKDWIMIIKAATSWEEGTTRPLTQKIIQEIRKKYFDNMSSEYPNIDFQSRIIQLATDANFKSCNDKTVKLLVAAGVPVYTYVWNYAGDILGFYIGGKPVAFHGIDMLYLFNATGFGLMNYTIDDDVQAFSDKVVDLWANFTAAGMPTPLGNSVEWTPTPISPIRYLNISKSTQMEEDYDTNALKFWDDIFYT